MAQGGYLLAGAGAICLQQRLCLAECDRRLPPLSRAQRFVHLALDFLCVATGSILVASGNLSWKEPDAFSVARQRLKNGYYALTLDCYPVKPLRLYLHFSQSAFEIASSRYAVNSFLGAGFRYDITRRWSLSADARNLLNRRDYQESLYTHSNYRYFRVPLRGREMMVSLRYHF